MITLNRRFTHEGATKLNEDQWFELFQPLLLDIVNTDYGRDIMCIDKRLPKIVQIRKNEVRAQTGENSFVSDFRAGSKWANVIRHRWDAFKIVAKSFYEKEDGRILIPYLNYNGRLVASNATDTFFPDANPETSSVDGRVSHDVSSPVTGRFWASLRGEVGNQHSDSSSLLPCYEITAGPSVVSGAWTRITRSIYLFDTSTLGASATLDDATFSVKIQAKTNTGINSPAMNVYSSAPASDTDLVNGDYNSLGTTVFSTAITFASQTTSAYNDFLLNTSGEAAVETEDVSNFGIRESVYDGTGSAPSWATNQNMNTQVWMAERTGTSEDPKLVVNFTVPVTLRPIIVY